jgi:predicted nucleic acid-binding protein
VIAADSSVVIAAAAPWHAQHRRAVAALADGSAALIAHVAYETTSALSRMPEGQRLAPAVVLAWLDARFPQPWLALGATATRAALRTAVEAGIRGGALYDALIAATAAHHGHTLLSADRRAARAYVALGADVSFIDVRPTGAAG